MLKRVAHSLGLVEHTERGSRRKNHLRGSTPSPPPPPPPPELYSQSNDFVVRIIHAGGHQEVYRHAVPASKLMRKYPGMCVARPEVFKLPHQSVLWHEEILVPGHKYILISFRDVEKLKRKLLEEGKCKEVNGVVLDSQTRSPSEHRDKVKVPNGIADNGKMKEPNGELETRTVVSVSPKGQGSSSVVKEMVDTNMDSSLGERGGEGSFFSAKDFYVHKEENSTTTRPSRRKGIKGKKPFVAPLPKPRPYRSLGWQPSLPTVRELSP